MNVPLTTVLALSVISFSSAHAADAPREIPSPFVRLADAAQGDAIEVAFDLFAYDALRTPFEADEVITLTNFELPIEGRVDLILQPHSVMPEGGLARVVDENGIEGHVAPSLVLYTGHVQGRTGDAVIGITETMVNGYVRLGDDLYFLSSGGSSASGSAMVSSARAFSQTFGTSTACHMLHAVAEDSFNSGGGSDDRSSATLRTAEWFVECEREYRNLFSSDQEAADFALLLFGASSEIFRRDIGTELVIPSGYLRIWNTNPPWGDVDDYNGIYDLRDWWTSNQNPDRNIDRAGVHLLCTPVFGGVAYLDVLCNNTYGYGVSSVYGSFPHPIEHTDPDNWDLLVVSHELGHNFDSNHTFNYNPPIECEDGSGPDKGTLMGYCHQNPGGVNNVGMRFHSRVQTVIRRASRNAGCIDTQSIACGDYNANGSLDASDLARLDQYLQQGFYSGGCEDVFDMDNDGDVDRCDYALLAAAVAGTEIGMYADPPAVSQGDFLELGACGGEPGNPMVIFLTAINGSPFSFAVHVGSFDGNGEESIGGPMPSASTATLTLQTFALNAMGEIILSQTQDVELN